MIVGKVIVGKVIATPFVLFLGTEHFLFCFGNRSTKKYREVQGSTKKYPEVQEV
jgi:hypothetical protein